ncbi:hypothetical protein [Kitasatospora sp. NPDC001095]
MHPAQLEEFTLRTRVQPVVDVLRSATAAAARLLGMAGEIGTPASGAQPTCSCSTATRSPTSPCSPAPHPKRVVKAGVPV